MSAALDRAFVARAVALTSGRDDDLGHFLSEKVGNTWTEMGLFYSSRQAMQMRPEVKIWLPIPGGWISECGNYRVRR